MVYEPYFSIAANTIEIKIHSIECENLKYRELLNFLKMTAP